jgi:hypothetical protein
MAKPLLSQPNTYLSNMRIALAFILLTTPAAAWEFSALPICTLSDSSDVGEITVTYDAQITEYTITVTIPDGTWPDASTFAMAFAGDRPISIQTDRYALGSDGRSLTVKDRGFGNVLNGLEFNSRAYAVLGETTVGFSLNGIGPAISAFRACPAMNLT